MNKYTDRAVMDIDEAGSIIANKNITIDCLTEQLAASQAREQQLLEAFQTYIDEHEECTYADDWMAMMCSIEAHHVADEALALPQDTTALDQVKASYEAQIQQLRDSFENYIRSMNMVDAKQALALALPTDTSALEAIVAKAGEVMRERCAEYATEHFFRGYKKAEEIRALPGVTLEDLQK